MVRTEQFAKKLLDGSLAAGHCLKNVRKVTTTDASFLAPLAGVNVNNQVELLCYNAV